MANKYLSASLGTRNWNDTTGTWVTSNGGTTPTTAPTTSDIVYCTSLSGNVTSTTASDVAGTLYCTGYTGTLTINASCKLLVVSNLTLSATMTMVNNGTFQWTSNLTNLALGYSGISIPGNVTLGFYGNKTYEIGSNFTFLGIVTIDGQCIINNYSGSWSMYFQGGVVGANYTTGNISIYLQGGTISSKFATVNVYLDGNLTVRAGTSTFTYIGFGYSATNCTVTWLSGTFTSTPSFIEIKGNITFNTGSDVVFDKLQFLPASPVGNATLTLSDDLYVKDILLQGSSDSYTTVGAYSIKCSGSLYSYTTNTFYSVPLLGDSTFEMVGTGTLGIARNFAGSASSKPVTYLGMNTVINTAGTMTWGAIGFDNSKTLTYTAGTLAGSGTVYIVGTYSLSGDITYPNIVVGFQNKGIATGSDGPYVCNFLTDCTVVNLTENYNSTINSTDT